MEKFMLILREDCDKLRQITTGERFLMAPVMLDWIKSISESGHYIGGDLLGILGRYVKKEDVLCEGPFIESKEGVSGYDIILAENLNQATAIAQTCPLVALGLGIREVRPILQVHVAK